MTALHREQNMDGLSLTTIASLINSKRFNSTIQICKCPFPHDCFLRPLLTSFRYRRRAAYHYDLTKRKPRSTGRDYESCDNCELVAHTRRHLQYALDACNAGFELDLVRYGLDHPVVEETIRRSAEIREKKTQFHSPKLR